MNSIAELAELMPPHQGAGEAIDWNEVTERWGTRFPDDYVEFMARYGGGSINANITIGVPSADSEPGRRSPTLAILTSVVPAANDYLETDLPVFPEPGGLISWCTNMGSDHAFWDTSHPDPNDWSTVVLSRGRGDWIRYPFGMTEFLVKLLRGELEPVPMGGRMTQFPQPKFVGSREEKRLRALGISPWLPSED